MCNHSRRVPSCRSTPAHVLLAAAVLFTAPTNGSAQSGSITGVVTDCTGTPVASVQLFFPSHDLGALTNTQGRFLLLNVPMLSARVLVIERIGYASQTVPVPDDIFLDLGIIALACDHVRMYGLDPVTPPVFLFDGRADPGTGATCVNDRVYTDASGNGSAVMLIPEDVLTAGTCSSEVSLFSSEHAVAHAANPPEWKPGVGDVVQRALTSHVAVPLNLWVSVEYPDIAIGTAKGTMQALKADFLFRDNRVGLTFATSVREPVPSSGLPVVGDRCSDAETNNLNTTAWYVEGELNVYVVGQAMYVDPTTSVVSPVTGVSCSFDRNVVYLSYTSDVSTLAHELGHAFGFRCFVDELGDRVCRRQHTDLTFTVDTSSIWCTSDADPSAPYCQPPPPCPSALGLPTDAVSSLPGCQPFDQQNIMWPMVSSRTEFALGQAYHMTFEVENQLHGNGNLSGPSKDCRKSPLLDVDVCPLLWINP